MSNTTIHLENVACSGNEYGITECAKTINSVYHGIRLLSSVEVAGVDCIYDEPTPPPCVVNPDIDPKDSCTSTGSIRLVNADGAESNNEGRVEYCNGQYWTPLCTMDNRAAAVACKQLGHTQYQCMYITYINYILVE